MMDKINTRFLLSILLPLGVGITSSLFSSAGILLYKTMPKPPLSPPAFLFPLVWTILYVMMGTASYMIWNSDVSTDTKKIPTILYLLQLFMNFFWSIIFFTLNLYTLALIWLIVMYIVILTCTCTFFTINKNAGWLMIPYNLWMVFAFYLNLSIVTMN